MIAMPIRRYVIVAAAALSLIAVQPRTAWAQATGVGGDGNTSLLWKGTDSSIILWRFDSTLGSVIASHSYGPYTGWTPVALTTDIYSYSHVLWKYTDGSIALWSVDPALNFAGDVFFGPYFGWTAESLSADPVTGSTRILWKRTDGTVALFSVTSAGNLNYEGVYGPIIGYDPASASQISPKALKTADKKPSTHIAAVNKTDEAAAASMTAHRASKIVQRR